MSGHQLLDLRDSTGGVQALGASPRAVKNGVATVDAHAVIQGVLALGGLLVTGIGQPTVRLEEDSRSEVLLAVPPVRGAGRGAAGTQNALVETIQLLAVFGTLTEFKALCIC